MIRSLVSLAIFAILLLVLWGVSECQKESDIVAEYEFQTTAVNQQAEVVKEEIAFMTKNMEDFVMFIKKDEVWRNAAYHLSQVVAECSKNSTVALQAIQRNEYGRFIKYADLAIHGAIQFLVQARGMETGSGELDILTERLTSLCPAADKMVRHMAKCNTIAKNNPDLDLKSYFFFQDWTVENYDALFAETLRSIREGQ